MGKLIGAAIAMWMLWIASDALRGYSFWQIVGTVGSLVSLVFIAIVYLCMRYDAYCTRMENGEREDPPKF